MSTEHAREENAYTLGVHAYLWGFSLYFYSVANAEGLKAGGVGLNSVHKFTTLKTAKDRFVVTPIDAGPTSRKTGVDTHLGHSKEPVTTGIAPRPP